MIFSKVIDPTPPLPVAPTRYQYETWVAYGFKLTNSEVLGGLDELGADGWEVISFTESEEWHFGLDGSGKKSDEKYQTLTFLLCRSYTDGKKIRLPHQNNFEMQRRDEAVRKIEDEEIAAARASWETEKEEDSPLREALEKLHKLQGSIRDQETKIDIAFRALYPTKGRSTVEDRTQVKADIKAWKKDLKALRKEEPHHRAEADRLAEELTARRATQSIMDT
ncbi:hypothetical protein J4729_23830 [Leisingera sp. HS039]|uniref:hypothetical protein n=1 Tax=Leisingera sp. HS039 TaxID=2818496 RepID=UPI001B39DDF5|nr:hypothetical protein [Leisingera sp. HS039]MBQ4827534.1 hypothetical protein [Leisingera sp. HS039]